jgi:hypothetical protein
VIIIKTDTIFAPEKQYRLYKFLVESKETEIKHLWKVNLIDFGLERANITYEQRLSKSWNVEGYLSYGNNWKPSAIEMDFEFLHHNVRYTPQVGEGATLELEQLFKYYYNLHRREQHGKKTNGFSGNYFATSILFNHNNNPVNLDTDTDMGESCWNFDLGIRYGIQRRIGNLGYYELYAGISYRWESVVYDPRLVSNDTWSVHNDYPLLMLGLKVGFAVDTFDNLRKMIKK